jgi:hypothetical protein
VARLPALKVFEFGFLALSALWAIYLMVALFFYYRRCVQRRPAQQCHAVLEVDAGQRFRHPGEQDAGRR